MARLHILQSIWAMDALRSGEDWSLSQRMRRIRDAGFDGLSTHFFDRARVASWIGAAKDHGFVIEGQAFPTSVEDLRPAVELAAEHGIHHLAVQADVRPESLDEAAEILAGWQRLGAEYGVPVLIETHRNMLTTDLWATCVLLDRLPDLPLVADLSHYVVGQEIVLPVSPRNGAKIDRILGNARAFHGRVASSGQVQVEIGFPCHRPWRDQFLAWWEQGFRTWLAQAEPDGSLTFTCELGPQPYAIAGPDGRDLSDRWQDAQTLRAHIADLRTKLGTETGAGSVIPNSGD